jgi:hypothetical protein
MLRLFLILPTHDWHGAVFELLFQILVHGEGHGLAGRYSHDTGCDTLVEGVESFLSISPRQPIFLSKPHSSPFFLYGI